MSALPLRAGFAGAAARLAASRTKPQERRRFRRAPIVVGGRMLDPSGRELDCRTADISPGDIRLYAPTKLDVGQRVVMYLDAFGRVSARVARVGDENEFAMIFEASAHKREKMAETLTWLINKDKLGLEDQRKAARDGLHRTRIELENGQEIEGAVLDFSLAGMTIRTLNPPPLGSWVKVSGVYGRVARWIDGGFAIDFEPKERPPSRG
jgi:hypothetical protein